MERMGQNEKGDISTCTSVTLGDLVDAFISADGGMTPYPVEADLDLEGGGGVGFPQSESDAALEF